MSIPSQALQELSGIFGDRIRTSIYERIIYSHDVSAPPWMIRYAMNTLPDAVVQPISSEDLRSLISIASKYNLQLIPRGSGTSGVGSCIPSKGGIVVDFSRMRNIVSIDPEKLIARVEPGVRWWDLERELNKHGLSLRCYPTSALSSTVGGWIAQGGYGIGSFKYGSIGENLEWVKILTPGMGEIQLSGEDLDLVVECQGSTGFITEACLKVKRYQDYRHILVGFQDPERIPQILSSIQGYDIYSISIYSGNYLKLASRVLEVHSVSHISHVPSIQLTSDTHCMLITMEHGAFSIQAADLMNAVSSHGKLLEESKARALWEERFYPLRPKNLGPSLIIGEAVVPVEALPKFIQECSSKFGRDPPFYGYMVKGNLCVVLVLLPDDETRTGYFLSLANPLEILDIAKKLGGRPYSTGLYLGHELELVLGKQKLSKIKSFKKRADPKELLNPKILRQDRVRIFFIPLVRFGTALKMAAPFMKLWSRKYTQLLLESCLELGERRLSKIPRLSAELGLDPWEIYSCAQCGYCSSNCPVFRQDPWATLSMRGRILYLKSMFSGEAPLDEDFCSKSFMCTTCGYCATVCTSKICTVELMERLRTHTRDLAKIERHDFIANAISSLKNPYGRDPQLRTSWISEFRKLGLELKDALREKVEVLYYTGCTAALTPDLNRIAIDSAYVLSKLGVDFGVLGAEEVCCGSVAKRTGRWEVFESISKRNAELINQTDAKMLVTACAGCYRTLTRDYDGKLKPRVMHIVQFIRDELLRKNIHPSKLGIKVTYHDPCHLGRHSSVYDAPRELLKLIGAELVEMEFNRENSRCCGAGGGVRSGFPEFSLRIARDRVMEAMQTGAEYLVTPCPFCIRNLGDAAREIPGAPKVVDVIDLVRQSLA